MSYLQEPSGWKTNSARDSSRPQLDGLVSNCLPFQTWKVTSLYQVRKNKRMFTVQVTIRKFKTQQMTTESRNLYSRVRNYTLDT